MAGLIVPEPRVVAPGAVHYPGWLDGDQRRTLLAWCRRWAHDAGGFRAPRMPRGGTMSVGITCLGWHWYPYRYSRTVDDGDGRAVAAFPAWLGDLGRKAVADAASFDRTVLADAPFDPDVALVNWYGPGARMGMHVDRDEPAPAPVVSLSLGDTGVFRFGTAAGRGRPWTDVALESGDLFVFGGASRRAYHGVPKVIPGTGDPDLGPVGGRLNLTMRQSGLDAAATSRTVGADGRNAHGNACQ